MIGVQIEGPARQYTQYLGKNTFAVDHVYWSDCEPEPGHYVWPADLDADQAALKPWPVVLNVKSCPPWARMFPDIRCSAPKGKYLDDYGRFVRAVVERYRPWAVEVWNEPEPTAQEAAGFNGLLGGFGPELAGHYGSMVAQVYKALKGTGTLVLAGALMMGDRGRAFWAKARKTARGKYHGVSFHCYVTHPSGDWAAIEAKAKALRETGEKAPLWVTETSYLVNSEFTDAQKSLQAQYAAYVFDNYRALGVEHLAWYSLAGNGWKHSDLIEKGQKPAYAEYIKRSSAL